MRARSVDRREFTPYANQPSHTFSSVRIARRSAISPSSLLVIVGVDDSNGAPDITRTSQKEAGMYTTQGCIALAVVMTVVGAIASAARDISSVQASPSERPQNAITVTGCVEKADRPATAVSTAASAEKDPAFMLTNVRPGGANESAGTSGTSNTVKYPLGADTSKLSPHTGHRVEITGTFQPNTSGLPPTLKVDSLRLIAASCGTPQIAQ
jgi:hypothetical protein